MQIRRATVDDVGAIVGFTTDTFPWGDYVPSMIEGWIVDTEGIVVVATDADDAPIGMARAVFLTPQEVWSHAARVDLRYRGRGIAGDLADALMAWARERGGLIVRLLIEDDNLPSSRHVSKKGFRRTVSVVRGRRAVGAASPNPDGNGGRRHPSALVPRPGKVQDVPLVRSSWSTSETGRVLRGLVGTGWRFHRLRDEDIEAAARSGNLWEVGNSWAITATVEPVFDVRLIDTTPDEAYDAIRGLIDTANNRGAEEVTLWLADTDWLVQAARRSGCEVSGFGVWERAL